MTTRKKKASKKKSSKKKSSRALANYDEELARYAQAAAAKEKETGGGNYISLRGGEFNYKGDVLENPLQVIVLDTAFENAYYDTEWDADNPSPPACFAVSAGVFDNDDLSPHETSPDVQGDENHRCENCEMNEWGSGKGKGKACSNNRRLMVISADDLDNLEEAEPALIRLSPSSIKYWKGYAKKITNVMKLPPFAVITELELVKEDGETYYVVKPSFVDAVDQSYIPQLIEMKEDNVELLETPYDVSNYGVEKPKSSGKQRRKVAKKKTARKKSGRKH